MVRDLSAWPRLLPHYRYVTTLRREPGREIVKMACWRSGLPIAWTSAYYADEQSLELHFEHLRAWTKGMVVVWHLTATSEGTHVEIAHDMRFRIPWLGWLAEPIIGGFFIDHVARKTLETFKAHLESGRRAGA